MSSKIAIGAGVVALLIGGAAVFFLQGSDDAPAQAAATPESAAAAAAAAPEERVPDDRKHVKLSNIRMKTPLVLPDRSKMSVPAPAVGDGTADETNNAH